MPLWASNLEIYFYEGVCVVPLGSEIMKYVVASATSVATAVKRIKASNVVEYVQILGEARA